MSLSIDYFPHVPVAKVACFFVLAHVVLYSQFIFKHHVEGTSTRNSTRQPYSKVFQVKSCEDFGIFTSFLKSDTTVEELFLTFTNFESVSSIRRFFNTPFQIPAESATRKTTNGSMIKPNSRSTSSTTIVGAGLKKGGIFGSTSHKLEAPVKLKSSKIESFTVCISSSIALKIFEESKTWSIGEVFKVLKSIYEKHPEEVRAYLSNDIHAILNLFIDPSLLINDFKIPNKRARCSAEFVDSVFSERNEQLIQSSNGNEPSLSVEIITKILSKNVGPILMSIFVKKVCEVVQTLPRSLKSLKLDFYSDFPVLFDITKSFQHLSNVRKITLSSTYFDYSNQNFIQSLSFLSSCERIVLQNDNLINQFLIYLFNHHKTVRKNDKMKDMASGFGFDGLKTLELNLLTESGSQIEHLSSIQHLRSLEALKISTSYQNLILILNQFEKCLNSRSLQKITFSIFTDGLSRTFSNTTNRKELRKSQSGFTSFAKERLSKQSKSVFDLRKVNSKSSGSIARSNSVGLKRPEFKNCDLKMGTFEFISVTVDILAIVDSDYEKWKEVQFYETEEGSDQTLELSKVLESVKEEICKYFLFGDLKWEKSESKYICYIDLISLDEQAISFLNSQNIFNDLSTTIESKTGYQLIFITTKDDLKLQSVDDSHLVSDKSRINKI